MQGTWKNGLTFTSEYGDRFEIEEDYIEGYIARIRAAGEAQATTVCLSDLVAFVDGLRERGIVK